MTAKQKIPKFKNIQEEAKFWDTHDVTDFLSEMHDVKVVFAEPSPKEETITIRVQPAVKATLRGIASSKGLNLSTLARVWLIEKLSKDSILVSALSNKKSPGEGKNLRPRRAKLN